MAYGAYNGPSAASYPPQAERDARRIGQIVNAIGAVISVALIVGLGLWSYRLMVRDVSGVPVIQALDGPMRVSPADPGGRQAAHQGLAVNAIAADRNAPALPRQIALAPQSTGIAPEDVITSPQAVRPDAGQDTGAADAPEAAVPAPSTDGDSAQPLQIEAGTVDIATEDLVPLGTPGVARSPIPPVRSEQILARAASAPAPLPAHLSGGSDRMAEAALAEIATRLGNASVTEIDPTSLTAGTRLVQLGAFESEDEARASWDTLSTRFPGYLDDRARVVEAATAGGRIFYRLRAHGFRDEPEARRFCSVFLADDVDCTPVLIR